MKTLYIDCGMGAAGDMLTAALLELFPQPEEIIQKLNTLGIPHVEFSMEKSTKCGITGTHMTIRVHGKEEASYDSFPSDLCDDVPDKHSHEQKPAHAHSHEHSHNTLPGIEHILEHTTLSSKLKCDVMAVYGLIAEAESKAHGVPVSEIHFHEVGNLDAIADISAVCLLMELLSPEKVIVSPVHVGSGQVRCAHGILPVPAPATAFLLKDCPIYGGKIKGELCTPTGAALLKYFADDFCEMPVMKVSSIGYGMGKKDFEAANCVRVLLGETDDSKDSMYELHCNLDDMTAEQLGYAMECLLKAGAADVFTTPVNMKKSRPGTLLCVLCSEEKKVVMIQSIFKHTSTAGIREHKITRSILKRSITETETSYGIVRRKDYSGYGVSRSKYEYDDLARIASEHGLSLEDVLKFLRG